MIIFPIYIPEKGRFLSLIETDKRPGEKYAASVVGSYHRFQNMCLEFFYRPSGDGESTLKVQAYNKLLTATDLLEITTASETPEEWLRVFKVLPKGLYRIAFTGYRNALKSSSGINIDDILIMPCSKFRKSLHGFL